MSHRGWVRERFAEVLGKRARIVVDWSRHTPTGLEDAWMRRQRRGHADIRAAIDHTDRALYGPRTDAKVAAQADEALQKAEEA